MAKEVRITVGRDKATVKEKGGRTYTIPKGQVRQIRADYQARGYTVR